MTGLPAAAADPALSVCMIVKDEANHMEEALANFQAFADEIIVVDTGSSDETKAIAYRFTPFVFDFEWCDDFSAARNYSLAMAHGRYILWLDADDRLTRENREKVNMLKSYFDDRTAFYLLLQDHGALGPSGFCHQLRCFPRKEEVRFRGRLHEQVYSSIAEAGLRTTKTDIVIDHHGYADPALFARKMRRNLALLERERAEGCEDERILFSLAVTYERLNRNPEAMKAMEDALLRLEKLHRGLIPQRQLSDPYFLVEAHFFLARLHLDRGEKQQALRHLIKAELMVTADPNTCFRMGCFYQELDRHSNALRFFQRALKGKPVVGFHPATAMLPGKEIYLHISLSLMCLDQEPLAVEGLKESGNPECDELSGWEWLGFHALKLGRLPVALRAYERAFQSGAELSPDGCCNLGLLYSKQGLPQKALEFYEAALRKDPRHVSAMANMANLYLKLEDISNAGLLYRRLLEEGSRDPDILLALANIAAKERDWKTIERSQQELGKVFSLDAPKETDSPDGKLEFFSVLAQRLDAGQKPRLAALARDTMKSLRAYSSPCSRSDSAAGTPISREPAVGLSIVMIGRNEEELLGETLRQLVTVADEIVFVDTGSLDGTIEIARRFNCRIHSFPWCDDFSKAKNFAIEQAKYRWILSVDCDEALVNGNMSALMEEVYRSKDVPAYLIWIENLYDQGRTESFKTMRLFRNDPRIRFRRPIHESIGESVFQTWPNCPIETIDIRLRHYGYLSRHIAGKHSRNVRMLSRLVELEPGDIFATYKLAVTLSELGQSQEALPYFEKTYTLLSAVKEKKTYPFVGAFLTSYGRVLEIAGQTERALWLKKATQAWN
jgi:glycosyltransferase involved in cell wall biosynthesis